MSEQVRCYSLRDILVGLLFLDKNTDNLQLINLVYEVLVYNEHKRREFLFQILCGFIIFLATFFCIYNFYLHRYIYAYIDAVYLLFIIPILIWHIYAKDKVFITHFGILVTYIYLTILLVEGTGAAGTIVWPTLVPSIAFFIVRKREAIFWCVVVILTVFTLIILKLSNYIHLNYQLIDLMELWFAIITVTSLSFLHMFIRDRIEYLLKREDRLLREVLRNMPQGLVFFDRNCRLLFVNPQLELWLRPSGIPLTLPELIGKELTDNILMRLKLAGRKEPVYFENVRFDWGGSDRFFKLLCYAVDDEVSAIIFEDISYLKQLELRQQVMSRQLERERRARDVALLLSTVAHDLKNLLTPLSGYISALFVKLSDREDLQFILQQMDSSLRNSMDTIGELLNFKESIELKAIDVHQLLKDLLRSVGLDEFKQRYPYVNFTVNFEQVESDKTEPVVRVRVAKLQLVRALLNLIYNSCDAILDKYADSNTQLSGNIELSAELVKFDDVYHGYELIPAGRYLKLGVKDDGIGIPVDSLDKVFDPLYTTKKKRNSKLSGGSGLGLVSVYLTVKQHGGYIDLISQEGKGTAIYLYLPIC